MQVGSLHWVKLSFNILLVSPGLLMYLRIPEGVGQVLAVIEYPQLEHLSAPCGSPYSGTLHIAFYMLARLAAKTEHGKKRPLEAQTRDQQIIASAMFSLLVTINPKANPDSRGGGINFTSSQEEMQIHVAKEYKYREEKNLSHFCNNLSQYLSYKRGTQDPVKLLD